MALIPVEFLLKTLSYLLVEEVKLRRNVRPEIEEIRLELQNMTSLLKDADRRVERGEAPDSVKEWVEQVRTAADDIEDTVDEFMLPFGGCGPFEIGTLTSFFSRQNWIPRPLKQRSFAMKIEDMKRRISAISARRDRYNNLGGLDEGTSSTTIESQQLTNTNEAYVAENSHVEGIHEDIDTLMRWAESGDRQLATILLVGMGGSGKTTLARKVYHNLRTRRCNIRRFDCFAWVPVTQSFNAECVLRRLLIELNVPDAHLLEGRDVTSLGETVRRHLHSQRYVIVLDDVWNSDVLNTISFAFPKSDCPSKLIITSRLEYVAFGMEAETGRPTKIHLLKPLNPKDSMKLFCRNAFRHDQKKNCPEHLQEICEKLVDRCNGLPLALVFLGAIISRREHSQLEWTSFHDRLSWELSVNAELGRLRGIFSLSYDELPIHLKACFLYCSIFPKNYVINANKLIRLWISEGFVEEKEGITLEQVGKQYLEELTKRSLLLVAERNVKGRVKTCQMHELLRELMMPMSRRQGLSQIIYGNNGSQDSASSNERSRSLSLVGVTDKTIRDIYLCDPKKAQRVRSLLMFDIRRMPSSVHKFILLRVLDMQNVFIEELLHSIDCLYHLRYLNLRNTNIRIIPQSLGNLHNLQALDIRDNQIHSLPNLSKAKKLRYVSAYSHVIHPFTIGQLSGCDFPSQICMSECLQKLSGINATDKIVQTIGNLTQLKNLGIFKVKEEQGQKLCESIEKMRGLLTLGISSDTESEYLRLESLTSPPPHLEDIWLFGKIDRFPEWIERLSNLRRLGLYFSKLRDSPIPYLENLPNLVWLKLYDAYDGWKLKFQGANSFPWLKTLMIFKFLNLRSIIVEDGALQRLHTLSIDSCPELKRMPDPESFTNLKDLHLRGMPYYTITNIPGLGEDQYSAAKIHLYKGIHDVFSRHVLK